jgi:hypothetical protein
MRDKFYTGTKFIQGQSLYRDKVYMGQHSYDDYGDKVYTGTKFIQGQSSYGDKVFAGCPAASGEKGQVLPI